MRTILSPWDIKSQSLTTMFKALKAQEGGFHAVILDVMMPQMDGFEVLKCLRQESDIPVLMLTDRGEETDRIVGFEMGADDYPPKTFSSRELLAQLRAVTRRYDISTRQTKTAKSNALLIFGELQIDKNARTVYLDTKTLDLTPIEYDLLKRLAESAGRVLTRDQLLDAVAGRSYEVFDRSIDVHISSLRRKLGEDPRHPPSSRIKSLGITLSRCCAASSRSPIHLGLISASTVILLRTSKS